MTRAQVIDELTLMRGEAISNMLKLMVQGKKAEVDAAEKKVEAFDYTIRELQGAKSDGLEWQR